MKVYTVYETGAQDGDAETRAERMVFIKDGFAVFAVISPFLWFLWHRLWLPLAGYVILVMLVINIVALFNVHEVALGLISSFLNLGVGLEANNIRRWMLERSGAQFVGVVSGGNLEECEYRFFSSWLPDVTEMAEPEKSLVARLETA